MAALLKEWLVEDLKINSSCAQLEKVQPLLLDAVATTRAALQTVS